MPVDKDDKLFKWFVENDCQGEALIDQDSWAEEAIDHARSRYESLLQLIHAREEAARKEERRKSRQLYAKRNPQYTKQWIADALGISRPTLAKWLDDPEQFTLGAVMKLSGLQSQLKENKEEV